jgi:hypothetical protein
MLRGSGPEGTVREKRRGGPYRGSRAREKEITECDAPAAATL